MQPLGKDGRAAQQVGPESALEFGEQNRDFLPSPTGIDADVRGADVTGVVSRGLSQMAFDLAGTLAWRASLLQPTGPTVLPIEIERRQKRSAQWLNHPEPPTGGAAERERRRGRPLLRGADSALPHRNDASPLCLFLWNRTGVGLGDDGGADDGYEIDAQDVHFAVENA